MLALATLSFACAHGAGGTAPPASPDRPLRLRFAWPARFTAQVLARHEAETWGADPLRAESRRLLSTERRGKEIFVFTRGVGARSGASDGARRSRLTDDLGEVITPDGSFVRAEGVDHALPLLQVPGQVATDVVRRALARSVAADWELMVGAWAGKTFVQHQPQRGRHTGSVPLMATAESLLEVELGFEGWVPCTPEAKDRRCVELHYRGRTAPPDRAPALARIREALVATPGKPVPEDFHGHFEVTLITEPATLVPHRLVDREFLRVRLRFEDGSVKELEERSQDEYVFTSPGALATPEPPRGGPGAGL